MEIEQCLYNLIDYKAFFLDFLKKREYNKPVYNF